MLRVTYHDGIQMMSNVTGAGTRTWPHGVDKVPAGDSKDRIRDALNRSIARYPAMEIEPVTNEMYDLRGLYTDDLDRFAFHLAHVLKFVPPGGRIADVGAGLGPQIHALTSLGYRGVVVDDFGDIWHAKAIDVLEWQKRDGVEVVSCDALSGVPLEEGSIDAVMTFDCLEHLHHSPKRMLQDCVKALKPGGLFFLGVPNCVNMRKRVTVPCGYGKWSRIEEWYDKEVFRGHVREPDVEDLRYIANSLGLRDVTIIGRNWLGYNSSSAFVRTLTTIADPVLQVWPSLCANIYVSAIKPGG
jgi:SAM-dependent methyltransferase